MKPKGRRVTCGCVMPHHLSVKQVSRLAFLHGLTMGLTFGAAASADWRERKEIEHNERIHHLLYECPRLHPPG